MVHKKQIVLTALCIFFLGFFSYNKAVKNNDSLIEKAVAINLLIQCAATVIDAYKIDKDLTSPRDHAKKISTIKNGIIHDNDVQDHDVQDNFLTFPTNYKSNF